MAVIELDVRQFFPMFQNEPPTRPAYAFASNYYQVSDSVNNFRKTAKATNLFSMEQVVTCRRSITNLTISQFLTLFSNGGKGSHENLVDFYFAWQNARTVLYEVVNQTLSLRQLVDPYRGHGVIHSLSISQIAIVNVLRGITVTQTYSPESQATGVIPNSNFIAQAPTVLTGPNGTPAYVF